MLNYSPNISAVKQTSLASGVFAEASLSGVITVVLCWQSVVSRNCNCVCTGDNVVQHLDDKGADAEIPSKEGVPSNGEGKQKRPQKNKRKNTSADAQPDWISLLAITSFSSLLYCLSALRGPRGNQNTFLVLLQRQLWCTCSSFLLQRTDPAFFHLLSLFAFFLFCFPTHRSRLSGTFIHTHSLHNRRLE